MDESKLYQPHDRLIKFTYGRKESASGLLQGYLPEEWVTGAQWETFEVVPGSFVDAALSGLHTDLLYRVKFKGVWAYMYCLFEHQSTPDPWVGLRILGYKTAIWKHLAQGRPKPDKVPNIYVLVLYNGKERWSAPLRWSKKVEFAPSLTPALKAMEVDFEYQLIDLSHLSADEIRGDVAGRLTLSLMKAALEDRVLEWLTQAAPLLKMLQEKEVSGMFEALLRYLLTVDTSMTSEKVFAALEHSQTPDLTQKAMSIADQLIAEGRKEGLLHGTIWAFQEMLGLQQSTLTELAAKSDLELQQLVDELRARWAKS